MCKWAGKEATIFFFFLRFYSWETERGQGEETQAEGEAGFMQEVRCGTQSWDLGITPWAKGKCSTAEPPRRPNNSSFRISSVFSRLMLAQSGQTWSLHQFFFFLRLYLFIHERYRERERERQRHRQREKQAPRRKPDAGLDPGSPGSCPGLKAALNCWATWAAIFPFFFFK